MATASNAAGTVSARLLRSNKNEEHTVVIAGGHAYADAWDKKAKTVVWQKLSDNEGYPARACDITLSEQGQTVWIKAATTDGQVYETSCVSQEAHLRQGLDPPPPTSQSARRRLMQPCTCTTAVWSASGASQNGCVTPTPCNRQPGSLGSPGPERLKEGPPLT